MGEDILGLNSGADDILPSDVAVNVANFGATGGGLADDTAAIQKAIDSVAGLGDIYLPAGTYLLNSSAVGLLLPRSASGLRIRGSGIGQTIIKLSPNTPTAFLPNRTADQQVFQNITITDLTVDCNNVPGQTPVLLGGLVSQYNTRVNWKTVRIARCQTINVPTGSYQGQGLVQGTYSNGSPTVSGVTYISGVQPQNGQTISGDNIPNGTTILSGAGTSTITLSQNATGSTGSHPYLTVTQQTSGTATGATTTSSATVTLTSISGRWPIVGDTVSGTGIPSGTCVVSGSQSSTVTLSQPATATGTPNLSFNGSYSRQNLALYSNHGHSNEGVAGGNSGSQSVIKDITIEDCDFQGGNVGYAFIGSCALASASTTASGANSAGQPVLNVVATTGFVAGETISIGNGSSQEMVIIQSIQVGVSLTMTTNLKFAHSSSDTVFQGTQANIFFDRIKIYRSKHDTLLDPSITGSGSHANIQIGGSGFGGTCDIVDFYGGRSGDVGIEIDSLTYLHVERTIIDDARGSGFLLRNFNAPESLAAQQYALRDTTVRAMTITPDLNNTWRAWGYQIGGFGAPHPMLGSVVMENCRYRSKGTTFNIPDQAISCNGYPVKRIVVNNFESIIDSVNFTVPNGVAPGMIWIAPDCSTPHVRLKNLYLYWNGTVGFSGGGAAAPQWVTVTPYNNQDLYMDLDDIVVECGLSGVVNGTTGIFNPGAAGLSGISMNGGTGTFHGRVKGFAILNWTSTEQNTKSIWFARNGSTAVVKAHTRFEVTGCDFSNSPSGFDLNNVGSGGFLGTGGLGQLYYHHNTGKIIDSGVASVNYPYATSTITPGASPYTYTNIDITPEYVFISGGTVSLIQFARVSGTNITTGLTAGMFTLDPGDMLIVTYTVAPTMTKVPVR